MNISVQSNRNDDRRSQHVEVISQDEEEKGKEERQQPGSLKVSSETKKVKKTATADDELICKFAESMSKSVDVPLLIGKALDDYEEKPISMLSKEQQLIEI